LQPAAPGTTLPWQHHPHPLEAALHPPPTILLTGFGPFPGVPSNPTAELATRLDGQVVAGHRVHGRTLEVSFHRAPKDLLVTATAIRPAAILMTGVAVRATRLRVEGCAVNHVDRARLDTEGSAGDDWPGCPPGERIATTAPVALVAETLNTRGLTAIASFDAGSYVCNSTYFRVLSTLGSWAYTPVALFMHIPLVGTASPDGRVWSAPHFEEAVRCALTAMVAS